jgi:uncharacterized membrane protein
MKKEDEQKFGLYVFAGVVIGAVTGAGLGIANGNVFNGLWIGALVGVSIGWFIAAAVREKDNKEHK